jgi:hypothetical protein
MTVYVVKLHSSKPEADNLGAIRWVLKRFWRDHQMRCVSISEEQSQNRVSVSPSTARASSPAAPRTSCLNTRRRRTYNRQPRSLQQRLPSLMVRHGRNLTPTSPRSLPKHANWLTTSA